MGVIGTLVSTGIVFFVDYSFTLTLKTLYTFVQQNADYAKLGHVRLKVFGATEGNTLPLFRNLMFSDPNDMTIMASLFQVEFNRISANFSRHFSFTLKHQRTPIHRSC